MSSPTPFRNISDTAIWAAIYRARENDRPNGLFRDPQGRETLIEQAAMVRIFAQLASG